MKTLQHGTQEFYSQRLELISNHSISQGFIPQSQRCKFLFSEGKHKLQKSAVFLCSWAIIHLKELSRSAQTAVDFFIQLLLYLSTTDKYKIFKACGRKTRSKYYISSSYSAFPIPLVYVWTTEKRSHMQLSEEILEISRYSQKRYQPFSIYFQGQIECFEFSCYGSSR